MAIMVSMLVVMIISDRAQKAVNARGGCPECGTPVPQYRRPTSTRQALLGGWTCSSCGTDMDSRGRCL